MSESRSVTLDVSSEPRTATVTVDVCTRPRFSVGGTRCQRCPPASFAKSALAPLPSKRTETNPGLSSRRVESKTPPVSGLDVGAEHVGYQKLRILTAFGGAYFNYNGLHGSLLS